MSGPVKYKVLVKRNNYNTKTLKLDRFWEEIITASTKEDLLKKVKIYFKRRMFKWRSIK